MATPFIVTFMVLSLAGIIDAGYLVYQHRQKKPLVCPLDHQCDVVTESKWSTLFYVRNDTLGLLFYISLLLGIVASILVPAWIPTLYLLLLLATGAGLLFSLFLIYLQMYVIKDYCFYCLISAGISTFLFVNSIGLYFGVA